MDESGREGYLQLTRHIRVPQKPFERFNLWMSDWIVARLPRLPLAGEAAIGQFPALQELQRHHGAIKAELLGILDFKGDIPTLDQIRPRDYTIASQGWRNFVLRLWGDDIPANAAHCPRTIAAVGQIPGVHTALFSILDGHSAIPEHRGWAAGVVRCHYPLITPDRPDECYIAIEDRPFSWREGQPLLFDDTRRHRVTNATSQLRVVLIVDFEPDIPFPLSAYCKLRFSLMRRTAEMRQLRERSVVARGAQNGSAH